MNKQLSIIKVIVLITICGVFCLFSSCSKNDTIHYTVDSKGNLTYQQGTIQEGVVNGIVKAADQGNALIYITVNDGITVLHKYDIAAKEVTDHDISTFLKFTYYEEKSGADTEQIDIRDFCCYGDTLYLLSNTSDSNTVLVEINLDKAAAMILDNTALQYSSVEISPYGDDLLLENQSDIYPSLFMYHIKTGENVLYESNASDYKVDPNCRYYSYVLYSTKNPNERTIIVKSTESNETVRQIPVVIENGALESFGGYNFDFNSNSINYIIQEQKDSFWDLVFNKPKQPLRTNCYSVDIESGKSEKILTTEWGHELKSLIID